MYFIKGASDIGTLAYGYSSDMSYARDFIQQRKQYTS